MSTTVSTAIQILLGLAIYIVFTSAVGQHLRSLRSAYPPASSPGHRGPIAPVSAVAPPATLPSRMAMLLA